MGRPPGRQLAAGGGPGSRRPGQAHDPVARRHRARRTPREPKRRRRTRTRAPLPDGRHPRPLVPSTRNGWITSLPLYPKPPWDGRGAAVRAFAPRGASHAFRLGRAPLGRGARPEAGGVFWFVVVGGVGPVVGFLVARLDEQVSDLVAEKFAVGAVEEGLPGGEGGSAGA